MGNLRLKLNQAADKFNKWSKKALTELETEQQNLETTETNEARCQNIAKLTFKIIGEFRQVGLRCSSRLLPLIPGPF